MRCCDCEFRNSCKDEDTVLTSFIRCSIQEEKLKKKTKQPEEYIKKSDLKNIGDVPWFDGRNGLNFDQHQTLVACCKAFREFVDLLPTADVVPRAEVARTKAMLKAMLLDAIDTFRNLLCIEAWLDYEDTRKHYVVSIDDVNRIHDEIKKKYTQEVNENEN